MRGLNRDIPKIFVLRGKITNAFCFQEFATRSKLCMPAWYKLNEYSEAFGITNSLICDNITHYASTHKHIIILPAQHVSLFIIQLFISKVSTLVTWFLELSFNACHGVLSTPT